MAVLVTGCNGFIGSNVARSLCAAGLSVIAATRRREGYAYGVDWRQYDLSWDELPSGLLASVDSIVHCAFVKRSGNDDGISTNIAGTNLLFDRAEAAGIPTIFLSTLAAHPAAVSAYGRHKYVLEETLSRRCTIIRPGLVLGDGGLFGAMAEHVNRKRLVPLIDGGEQPLQTVHIDDLCDAILAAIRNPLRGNFTVAEPDPVPYRTFVEALAERLSVRPRFIHVPFPAIDFMLMTAERVGVRLALNRDNLLGLKSMVAWNVEYKPLLDAPPRSYSDSLRALLDTR